LRNEVDQGFASGVDEEVLVDVEDAHELLLRFCFFQDQLELSFLLLHDRHEVVDPINLLEAAELDLNSIVEVLLLPPLVAGDEGPELLAILVDPPSSLDSDDLIQVGLPLARVELLRARLVRLHQAAGLLIADLDPIVPGLELRFLGITEHRHFRRPLALVPININLITVVDNLQILVELPTKRMNSLLRNHLFFIFLLLDFLIFFRQVLPEVILLLPLHFFLHLPIFSQLPPPVREIVTHHSE
jgi:hypothetical protein